MQALAQLDTLISNKGEQMIRYYGFYSKKLRGFRKKTGVDDQVSMRMMTSSMLIIRLKPSYVGPASPRGQYAKSLRGKI